MGSFNKEEIWGIVIEGTNKVIEKFRTKYAAKNSIPRFKKTYFDVKLEVLLLSNLTDK